MCFGDDQGRQAEPAPSAPSPQQQINDQEAQRQAAVKAGNTGIDTAFAKFNDPYFSNYEKTYKDFYNPQVDTQYTDAQGTLEAGLARNGTDRSSIAAGQFGRLFGAYADQKAQIGDQAASASADLRNKVSSEKSNLYALNSSSADPAQANTQALAAATSLVAPPAYTPLGAVFANILQPYTAYSNAYANNPGPGYTSPYSGSGTVVK
jgi:hypothetical protein